MFLSRPKVSRALSGFDHVGRRWAPIPLCDQHVSTAQKTPSQPAHARAANKQSLSLTTWNIQASWSMPIVISPVTRFELILDRIMKGPNVPDIIFLQEVTSIVRQYLLGHPGVQRSFLTTDAEDDIALKGVPFATMTLLSNKRFGSPRLVEKDGGEGKGDGESGSKSKVVVDSVFRTELPSKYERDALCVNVRHPSEPGSILRLINVHLDSLDAQFRRTAQVHVLADLLREPRCKGGVVAGDFNAIDPDDYTLVERYKLLDAWTALRGYDRGGAIWGVVRPKLEGGRRPHRLDKVVMLGVQPDEIEILQPGLIDGKTPWSDHCGLHCTFTV